MDKTLEYQALEHYQRRDYQSAIESYTKCLTTAPPDADKTDVLLNRASCHQKLSKYIEAIADCDEILAGDALNEKALWKKTKVLCFQGRFNTAMALVDDWLTKDPTNHLARKEKQRLGIVVTAMGEDSDDISPPASTAANNDVRPSPEGQESNKDLKPAGKGQVTDNATDSSSKTGGGSWFCGPCDLLFECYEEWNAHSHSDTHHNTVLKGGEDFKYRSPPRGLTGEEYALCEKFMNRGLCLFGDKCTLAHSRGELQEWRTRFDNKKREMRNAHNEDFLFIEKLPVMGHDLQVDSAPVTDDSQLTDKVTDMTRWDESKLNIIDFYSKQTDSEIDLLKQYPAPRAEEFIMSSAVTEPLSQTNYRQRMHDLLNIEEMEQLSCLSKYSVKAKLRIVDKFLLVPSASSTAKYAVDGQLFAQLEIRDDLTEDTSHGRLILQSCNSALLAPGEINTDASISQNVYKVLIEDKGRHFVFFRLSSACVKDLKLQPDQTIQAHMQFQLNRVNMCDMHYAVDNLPNVETVFPDISKYENIVWDTKDSALFSDIDKEINEQQHEAIMAVADTTNNGLPPVLLVGPYGTGKTYTLAQATKYMLKQKDTRVLICTHSNSAADLYIKDHFHPMFSAGHASARPLRVLYENRWIQTVPDVVLPYCIRKENYTSFRQPTKDDLDKHRIIVITIGMSRVLCDLNLPSDFFSHIFIDEAAQAMETESLVPLCLAGNKTRVVLAGDHMQLSPEVYSQFARDRGLHVSLLERLYDLYPTDFPCRIMLCENYRSHQAIIDFTSQLFYSHKLIASGKQLAHEKYHPLTFSSAEGEDIQHPNNTGYYNLAEVYEVAERVSELQQSWPKSWGPMGDNSVVVVTPYYDQVLHIRSELRKRKMPQVSVERVLNIQGKQFRVVILSTVRTHHTCSNVNTENIGLDYGFLSNVKLLNTAITRAQSLVMVVGDPVSLCSIGKCRKIWEEFIDKCSKNNSLLGSTVEELRSQFDGIEIKRTYVLNPLAPEFVPNRRRHGVDEETHAAQSGGMTQSRPQQSYKQKNLYPGAIPFVPMYSMHGVPLLFPQKPAYPAQQHQKPALSPASDSKSSDESHEQPKPAEQYSPKQGRKNRGNFSRHQNQQHYMPGYIPYQPYVPLYVPEEMRYVPYVPQIPYYPVSAPVVPINQQWLSSSFSRLGAPLIQQPPIPAHLDNAPVELPMNESNNATINADMQPVSQDSRARVTDRQNRSVEPRPWSPALPPFSRTSQPGPVSQQSGPISQQFGPVSQQQTGPVSQQQPGPVSQQQSGPISQQTQYQILPNVYRAQKQTMEDAQRGQRDDGGMNPQMNQQGNQAPQQTDQHVDRRETSRAHYKPYPQTSGSRLARFRKNLPDKLNLEADTEDMNDHLQTPAQMKEFMRLLESSGSLETQSHQQQYPLPGNWNTNAVNNAPAQPQFVPPHAGQHQASSDQNPAQRGPFPFNNQQSIQDNQPTYAGIVRRPAVPPLDVPTATDNNQLTPSPTTPAMLASTPTRDQVGSDALNILRHLDFANPQNFYQ